MRTRTLPTLALLISVVPTPLLASAEATHPAELQIAPPQVSLQGPGARQQLLVTGLVEGRWVDVTGQVTFESVAPDIAAVDARGVITPRSDGIGAVVAVVGEARTAVPVEVADAASDAPVTFERDIMPILTRAGCNSGGCHGKARGQNGFALSLLGYDPDYDFNAITKEARGRRVFPAAPEHSLVLEKGSAKVPHGGGPKLSEDGEMYATVLRWITLGMPRDPAEIPQLEGIAISPVGRAMKPGEEQRTIVTARYSDGSTRDVTHLSAFQSNESAVVSVDELGLIRAGALPGEAAITARFENNFATCEVTIPLDGEVPADVYAELPRYNYIDDLVWAKLQKLGLTPSAQADDATFLRRAHLDAIGRLPTPEETRAFLDDPSPSKRSQLVDRLLERPEYADHWANKWTDLLRPNPYRVGIKAVMTLDTWIRDAFRQNMPYDQFVREIVTARGSTFRDGPAVIFRDRRDPEELATMISQLFLGIRLDCARCHHHPFEVWGQDDFFAFSANFARVGRKGTGLSPPISGSEEIMFASDRGEVKHPLTGEVMEPRPLFGSTSETDEPADDPRQALAAWMTSPENDYFAQVIANRVWAEIMGRGIVDPVDDLRATNPPTNGPLLEALADDLRSADFDLKHLIRSILTSYTYGLASDPVERNVVDTRNYSRHYRVRLRAEVLLDAIADVTGVPESFDAAPIGTRSAALWTVRTDSLFLDTFGRPDPNQDPPCERLPEPSVVQALHLMNAPSLHGKITSDEGRAAQLAASELTPEQIIDELYLLTYSRFPGEDEREVALDVFDGAGENRRQAVEDLLWAMINTPEFIFEN